MDGAVLMGGCDQTPRRPDIGAISMRSGDLVPAAAVCRQLGAAARSRLRSLGNLNKRQPAASARRDRTRSKADMADSCTPMVMGTADHDGDRRSARLALPGPILDATAPDPPNRPRHLLRRRPPRHQHGVWTSRPGQILKRCIQQRPSPRPHGAGRLTNAIIHASPWRGAAGVPLDMARFDQISRQIPVIANVTPSGKYLMEDFFYAGGRAR